MRFWFDTEFIEDGKTIDLLSIGVLAEDGRNREMERALEADGEKLRALTGEDHGPWPTEKSVADIDAEANQFAMELLMPEDFVRKELKRMGSFDIEDEEKLKNLADKFRVSVPVMTIRLGQLLTSL